MLSCLIRSITLTTNTHTSVYLKLSPIPETSRTWLLGKLVCALLLDSLVSEHVDHYSPQWAVA